MPILKETIKVDLGPRSYPIYIGKDFMEDADLLRPHIKGRQVVVVADENVAKLYLDSFCSNFRSEFELLEIILPAGEINKNLESFSLIIDNALGAGLNRNATFIALGGGIVGDVTGFAAACYQRGVRFLQVPTTLLAQVDSSVGGKTGINHALGKNMIGAFYQPEAVLADVATLDTLSKREFVAGLAEVIKYGLIIDRRFYQWLLDNIELLLARDFSALTWAIRRSCELKAQVVSQDEREIGLRAILNLGHTFGHAIENSFGYGYFLHGEAVAIGLVMSSALSSKRGWIEESQVEILCDLLDKIGLPSKLPEGVSPEDFMRVIALDKKSTDDGLRFILLRNVGEAVVASDVTPEEVLGLF